MKFGFDKADNIISITDRKSDSSPTATTTSYIYDSWGVVTPTNSSNNSIGYTGQRLDIETGLMALGNGERYYSPTLARFIQQDSFTGSLNLPQSLNRFAYGYNNPYRFIDPSGNQNVFASGKRWTGNETADWWINFLGSNVLEMNMPTREKLGQSLDLWNSWALGVGDAFDTAGKGAAHLIHGLETRPRETLSETWQGIKNAASELADVALHPVQGFNILSEAAMNDPHAFMRSIGKASGEVVIAETTAKAVSSLARPLTSAVKQAVIGQATRLAARAAKTTAGRATSTFLKESVTQIENKVSALRSEIKQRFSSFSELFGNTFRGNAEIPKRSIQREPLPEFLDKEFYRESYSVKPDALAKDIAKYPDVFDDISTKSYTENPSRFTFEEFKAKISNSGNFKGRGHTAEYMFVVDEGGNLIFGSRAGRRMPHPTLIGGAEPKVLAAGMVKILRGKIKRVMVNDSGHFRPAPESALPAIKAFDQLPKEVFDKKFEGFKLHDER